MVEEAAPVKKSLRLIIAAVSVGAAIGAYFIVTNLPEKAPEYTVTESERYDFISSRESELASMVFDRIEDGTRLEFSKVEVGEGDEKTSVWKLTYPEVLFTPRERGIKDIAYSLASIYSDQLIEEEPADISIYGLDAPQGKLIVTTFEGDSATVIIGSKTPTGNAYYVLHDGDPAVYTLRAYTAGKVFTDLDDLRERVIAAPNSQELKYFKLTAEKTIEIVPMAEEDDFIGSALATLKIIKPYSQAKAVDSQRFGEMLETFPTSLSKIDFIEDRPSDLSKYGLSPPRYDLEYRESEITLHLLLGNLYEENKIYAKLPDEPEVFTLPMDNLSFIDTKAFTLIDKFVLIPNIDTVDRFTVTGNGTTTVGEIQREKNLSAQEGEKDDVIETYFVNGQEIEEDPFKKYYQKVIGLLVDAENPDPSPMGDPDVSVQFELNEGPEKTARADLVRVNRDFYAVYVRGKSEFLLSAYQVDSMFTGAEDLFKED